MCKDVQAGRLITVNHLPLYIYIYLNRSCFGAFNFVHKIIIIILILLLLEA